MYRLTLNADERSALKWVGHRYFHGDELIDILQSCTADDVSFFDDTPEITFQIPEHKAWEIQDGFQGENFEFACLSDDLAHKLQEFTLQIV